MPEDGYSSLPEPWLGRKKNIELAGKAAEGVISPLGRLVVWDKLSDKQQQKVSVEKIHQ